MAKRGPRLLVVVWHLPTHSETFITDHLVAMADAGWSVTLCCAEADRERQDDLAPLLERLAALVVLGRPPAPTRLARRLQHRRSRVERHARLLAPGLRRAIAEHEPDVLHAHFGLNAAAVGLALDGDDRPAIADLHGFDLTTVPAQEGWSAYRRLLAGQQVVVHSRFAAGVVRDGLGVEPTVVPVPVAPDFAPIERPREWPRPLQLLFVGRLIPEKGADVAIAALDHLGLDAHLTVVGDGSEVRALAAAARGRSVTFTGALPRRAVARAMQDHDILLVPSRPSPDGWVEAYGLVAAEARACGMGVVASDLGGLPESAGPEAVLVPPDDPRALAAGIERLVAERRPGEVTPPDDDGPTSDEVARQLL